MSIVTFYEVMSIRDQNAPALWPGFQCTFLWWLKGHLRILSAPWINKHETSTYNMLSINAKLGYQSPPEKKKCCESFYSCWKKEEIRLKEWGLPDPSSVTIPRPSALFCLSNAFKSRTLKQSKKYQELINVT